MKTMKLGKTGIDISRMGLGTWSIGGGSAWGGDHDLQVVVDTIREAPKLGVNLIDTAPGYNFGNSEKILGKALEGMNREDVVIITKCGVTWDQEMKGDLFNKVNGIQLYKNLNSASIKREIEESLKRMGTDYVDVYMTHWQSIEGSEYYVPIQKTMEVLNDLKAQGKIKAIGAANVDIKQIEEYLKWGELDIVQAKYSILDRGIEDEIIPCCRENGVTIQAYSPLEMGLLSGTMPRDYKPVGAQIPKKWFGLRICRKLWMLWISGNHSAKSTTVLSQTLHLLGFLHRATSLTSSAVQQLLTRLLKMLSQQSLSLRHQMLL